MWDTRKKTEFQKQAEKAYDRGERRLLGVDIVAEPEGDQGDPGPVFSKEHGRAARVAAAEAADAAAAKAEAELAALGPSAPDALADATKIYNDYMASKAAAAAKAAAAKAAAEAEAKAAAEAQAKAAEAAESKPTRSPEVIRAELKEKEKELAAMAEKRARLEKEADAARNVTAEKAAAAKAAVANAEAATATAAATTAKKPPLPAAKPCWTYAGDVEGDGYWEDKDGNREWGTGENGSKPPAGGRSCTTAGRRGSKRGGSGKPTGKAPPAGGRPRKTRKSTRGRRR